MIRFIDLRGQIFLDGGDLPEEQVPTFAFFDTVVDQFVGWDQEFAWSSQEDFATDYVEFGGWRGMKLERFLGLMSDWVPERWDIDAGS